MILVDGAPETADWVTDRGLAYGDGVFETIARTPRGLLAFDAHLARLRAGCEQLGFSAPDEVLLRQECEALRGEAAFGVVKIIVTRGSGGRGYRAPSPGRPRRIVMRHDWPTLPPAEARVETWLCAHRLGLQPATAGLKHLNRLDQVLASREWPDADCFEGLMLDLDGHLVEGTRSNLFLVFGDELRTPSLARCGIAGIVREAVMRWCTDAGVRCIEAPLHPADLADADEAFLTNSVIGVRGIAEVRGLASYPASATAFAPRLSRALCAAGVTP